MPTKLMFSRRTFTYAGRDLARGEIFGFGGAFNDEKLERLGYVAPLPKGYEEYKCAECGRVFIDEGARRGHGDREHPSRDLNVLEQMAREDAWERQENEISPLYLDKTLAAQKGN